MSISLNDTRHIASTLMRITYSRISRFSPARARARARESKNGSEEKNHTSRFLFANYGNYKCAEKNCTYRQGDTEIPAEISTSATSSSSSGRRASGQAAPSPPLYMRTTTPSLLDRRTFTFRIVLPSSRWASRKTSSGSSASCL